jgi:membrane protease YdiL (CAAX protease family)
MEPVPPRLTAPPLLTDSASGPGRARWWIHLLLIAAYPVVIGIISAGHGQQAPPVLGTDARQLVLISSLELGLFTLVFGLAWIASHASSQELLLSWRGRWRPLPLGLGYSLVLRVGLAVVAGGIGSFLIITRVLTADQLQNFLLANRPDVGAIVDVAALKTHPLYYWLNLTLVSFVIGGLREELWRAGFLAGLRKLWPARFGSRSGAILGVAIAAVAFGLGHLVQGPLAVCFTALLGFGLGLIMVVHRSIWPAVLAHGFFNATSFALIPFALEKLPGIR